MRLTKELDFPAGTLARAVAVSLVTAAALYWVLQVATLELLVKAYSEASFKRFFCESRPAYDTTLCESADSLNVHQVRDLLVAAELADKQWFKTERADKGDHLTDLAGMLEELEFDTAMGFVIQLAGKQCNSGQTTDDTKPMPGDLQIQLRNDLARAFSDAVDGSIVTGRCAKAREFLANRIARAPGETEYSRWSPWAGLRLSNRKCLSDALIVGALLERTKAIKFADASGATMTNQPSPGFRPECFETPNSTGLDNSDIERHRLFTSLIEYVTGQLHLDPKVRQAQKAVTVVRGPEQFFILTTFLLTAGLAASRWIAFRRRYKLARSDFADEGTAEFRNMILDVVAGGDRGERARHGLSRGRVVMHWGLATMPALGFVGTVRGILEAMTKAGDIVWATEKAERAEAITLMSTELGLAFSTTFAALVFGIVAGLIVMLGGREEERMISIVEAKGLGDDAAGR